MRPVRRTALLPACAALLAVLSGCATLPAEDAAPSDPAAIAAAPDEAEQDAQAEAAAAAPADAVTPAAAPTRAATRATTRQGAARGAAPASAAMAPVARDPSNPHGIPMRAGAWRCELGRSVQVQSVSQDLRTAVLRWDGREHTLRAVHARSGALRYEDAGSGWLWLVIPGKAMLLDARLGQRLASDCRI